MTTKTMRSHPTVEAIAVCPTRQLWQYVIAELDFLATPDQRRVPQSVDAAIRELHKRTRAR